MASLLNMSGGSLLGKGLPYDAEIEYLESSGTQWIDTGVYGNLNTSFKIRVLPTATKGYATVLGSRYTSASKRLDLIFKPTGLGGWFGYGLNNNVSVAFNYSILESKEFFSDKGKFYIDGSLVGSLNQISFTTPSTLKIFCNDTDGTLSQFFYGKLYYIKIWDNGILVRDFIPVRVGTTGYLYDKVSGQLFGNSGTGSFILGPDKQ